jgi:hypothetical protein
MLHKATMSRKHYITICTAKTAQFLFSGFRENCQTGRKGMQNSKNKFYRNISASQVVFLFSNLSLSFLSVADNYKEEKEKPAFCSSLPLGFLCYDIFSKFSRIK